MFRLVSRFQDIPARHSLDKKLWRKLFLGWTPAILCLLLLCSHFTSFTLARSVQVFYVWIWEEEVLELKSYFSVRFCLLLISNWTRRTLASPSAATNCLTTDSFAQRHSEPSAHSSGSRESKLTTHTRSLLHLIRGNTDQLFGGEFPDGCRVESCFLKERPYPCKTTSVPGLVLREWERALLLCLFVVGECGARCCCCCLWWKSKSTSITLCASTTLIWVYGRRVYL